MVYIPVGINCNVALFLRARGMRREAMPFDWNVCTLDRISALLETGFENWMGDLEYLPGKEKHCMDGGGAGKPIRRVWCNACGVLFRHDFFEAIRGIETIATIESAVREKYRTRIRRLDRVLRSGTEHVVFVTDWDGRDNDKNCRILTHIKPENLMATHAEVAQQVPRFARAVRRKYPALSFEVKFLKNNARLVDAEVDVVGLVDVDVDVGADAEVDVVGTAGARIRGNKML